MKRNRVISVILVVMVCLSVLVGCVNKNKVKEALQGTWVAQWTLLDKQIVRYYTFSEDTYVTGGVAALGEVGPNVGTYEIKNSVIRCIEDDGSVANELEYTYDEATGTLTLWWSDSVQFQKQ